MLKLSKKLLAYFHQLIENYLISRWVEFYSPFRVRPSATL